MTLQGLLSKQIRASFRLGWQRSDFRHSCDVDAILNEDTFGEGLLFCVSGQECGTSPGRPLNLGLLEYWCLTFSVLQDWTYGEGFIDVTFPSTSSQVVLTTGACCWQSDLEYRLSLNLSLAIRPNTRTINASPRAAIVPMVALYPGCNEVLRVPVFDPDDDIVRCRWGMTSDECGDICGPIPGVSLDQVTCTLSFVSARGSLPVPLVLEDYSRDAPGDVISQVALQFLAFVDDRSDACTYLPHVVVEDRCVGVPVGDTLSYQLVLWSGAATLTISEFHSVGFLNVETSRHDDLVSVSWTPLHDISGVHCFLLLNELNISSVFECVMFTTEAPVPITESLSPYNELVQVQPIIFLVTFTHPIQRPKTSANISFVASDTGEVIYTIDVTSDAGLNGVKYFENHTLGILFGTYLQPPKDLDLYVRLDSDVVLRNNCAIGNTAVTDRDFWPVTIAGKFKDGFIIKCLTG